MKRFSLAVALVLVLASSSFGAAQQAAPPPKSSGLGHPNGDVVARGTTPLNVR
jgi:hypothetical protein